MTRLGQLPKIFDYIEPEFTAFTYDIYNRKFHIGNEEHALSSPNMYETLLFPAGSHIPASEIAQFPAVFDGLGHPIATPKLYSWLQQPTAPSHFQDTADVMRDTFATLDNINLTGTYDKKMSPFGFSCNFIREGHVTLTVLGNCACLGTNPDGHLIDYHDWDTGFAELDFHNIDTPTQYISLLSGLGHLATKCNEAG